MLDLRRTRSSENLLHNAESTDLGQSLFEIGKPSIDQDSVLGGTGTDSIQELKKQQSELQDEETIISPVKGIIPISLYIFFFYIVALFDSS